jgi:predicted nuclease of predicted toxin-antitoxin system
MRVILGQGVPRDAATLLRELGHECMHVGEAGMLRASDEEIIVWAREQKATVVTLDADFHAILAVSLMRERDRSFA